MFNSTSFLENMGKKGIEVREPRKQTGGNSHIFFLKLDGQELVLKVYKGDEARKRISRERELNSYRFLNSCGFTSLPKLYEEIVISDGILIEHLNGQTPTHSLQVNSEILKSMVQLSSIYESNSSFMDAVEACYSTQNIITQIQSRIINLRNSLTEKSDKLQEILSLLEQREPISFAKTTMTYSMSDIGVHNMVQLDKGLKFLDFEFFGKDSAVKMIVDYLLHPKNSMSKEIRSQTLEFAETQFGIDLDLAISVTPFFAAKWATIVLRRLNLIITEAELHKTLLDFHSYLELARLEDREQIHAKLLMLR